MKRIFIPLAIFGAALFIAPTTALATCQNGAPDWPTCTASTSTTVVDATTTTTVVEPETTTTSTIPRPPCYIEDIRYEACPTDDTTTTTDPEQETTTTIPFNIVTVCHAYPGGVATYAFPESVGIGEHAGHPNDYPGPCLPYCDDPSSKDDSACDPVTTPTIVVTVVDVADPPPAPSDRIINGPGTNVPPSSTTTTAPDVCYMPDGTVLAVGEYVKLADYLPGSGTTHYRLLPCGPISGATPLSAGASLAATGGYTAPMIGLGLGLVGAGIGLVALVRRGRTWI